MSMGISGNLPSMPMGQGMKPPPLSSEQKSAAESVLAQYDASALTEDDAKAINEAFKEAGIRPNGELKGIIEDAGFDAGQLAELGGVQGPPGGMPPPPPPSGSEMGEVNSEALQMLQDILSEYSDLSSLSADQQDELNSTLLSSGLLDPGALFDTHT